MEHNTIPKTKSIILAQALKIHALVQSLKINTIEQHCCLKNIQILKKHTNSVSNSLGYSIPQPISYGSEPKSVD